MACRGCAAVGAVGGVVSSIGGAIMVDMTVENGGWAISCKCTSGNCLFCLRQERERGLSE
jgi:hypothetical protein